MSQDLFEKENIIQPYLKSVPVFKTGFTVGSIMRLIHWVSSFLLTGGET